MACPLVVLLRKCHTQLRLAELGQCFALPEDAKRSEERRFEAAPRAAQQSPQTLRVIFSFASLTAVLTCILNQDGPGVHVASRETDY